MPYVKPRQMVVARTAGISKTIRSQQAIMSTQRKRSGDAIIIAVGARKGGSCKTTDSMNLSAWFALRGYKTLFLEIDDHAKAYNILISDLGPDEPPLDVGRTTYTLFYPNKYSIRDATFTLPMEQLLGRTSINREPLQKIMQDRGWTEPNSMDMIPGTPALRLIEREFAQLEMRAEAEDTVFEPSTQLRHSLGALRAQYDIIVCDTPPSLTTVLMNVLLAADFFFVPVELFPSSIGDYYETMRTFDQVSSIARRLRFPAPQMLGTVANRKQDLPGHESVLQSYIAQHEDSKTHQVVAPRIPYSMLGVIPLDSESVDIAERRRIPMIIQAPTKPVGAAFSAFGLAVEKRIGL